MSWLSDFARKNKRAITGTVLGSLGGTALGRLLPKSAGMFGSAAKLGTIGGATGGAIGWNEDQKAYDKQEAFNYKTEQERARIEAGIRLEDDIEPFLPGEDDPDDEYPGVPNPPNEPPIAIEPPIEQPVAPPPQDPGLPVEPPVIDPPSGPIDMPTVDPGLGNINTGGPETGVGSILDETERARQLQLDLINQQRTDKDTARAEMAEILNNQMNRQFDENKSGIYEDLNRRGMLRSSHAGEALAEERGRLSAGVNEQLGLQGIQDKYGSIDALTGVNDQYLSGRQGAMGRKFSLEDWARQMKASKELGQAVTPIQPYTGGGKSGSTQAGMAGAQLGMSAMGGK